MFVHFTIALKHRRLTRIFIVKAEKDDIFIASPTIKERLKETIFLTRTEGQWVGDCDDKKLVLKLGREIEFQYSQQATANV